MSHLKNNQDNNLVFRDWHENPSRKRKIKKLTKLVNENSGVALIGAPNVGKSTFFNKITHGTASVSNVDRLTVTDESAKLIHHKDINIVDLPGIYNLSHPVDEEAVVAHEMFHKSFNKIVNIIGSQSIERDLFLSLQAIESGLMSTLVINMIDEVNAEYLNTKKLSKMLNGIKVITCQANKNVGTKQAIDSIVEDKPVDPFVFKYPDHIEKCIKQISNLLPETKISKRYYALMFLEGNKYAIEGFPKEIRNDLQNAIDTKVLNKLSKKKIDEEIHIAKKAYIQKILKECIQLDKYFDKNKNKQKNFDIKLLKKYIGIPSFFFLICAIYFISFGPYMGGTLKDLFGESFLNKIVADQWLTKLFDLMHANNFVKGMFIDGIFKGFFAVLSFAPTLLIFFTLINVIQQVGILSRVSVLLDNALDKFGISGRSVISLLTGFGCNVPAVMMARSSNSKKERIVSILVSPFIICSARVIVINFICNTIFGKTIGWLGMILLILISGLVALSMGLFFSKTMFRKVKSFFLVEMVDWRRPDFIVIAKLVWDEIKAFVKKAGLIIVLANIIIWFVLHLGPTGALSDSTIDKSFMAYFAKGFNYLLYPAGFRDSESWRLTASLITAFPAKEIAVTNINLLFNDSTISFASYTSQHLPTCLSYLVIFCFYLPCAATIATMVKESNWKYVGIHIGSSLALAYVLGFIIYWVSLVVQI